MTSAVDTWYDRTDRSKAAGRVEPQKVRGSSKVQAQIIFVRILARSRHATAMNRSPSFRGKVSGPG